MATALKQPRSGGERIPPDSPLAPYISIDTLRLHGEPCFRGTRVPVQALFDMLADGASINDFVDAFPPVKRDDAVAVLHLAATGLLEGLRRL